MEEVCSYNQSLYGVGGYNGTGCLASEADSGGLADTGAGVFLFIAIGAGILAGALFTWARRQRKAGQYRYEGVV